MDRIVIDNVKLMFGERTLFETDCFKIGSNEIYPLLGLNGTGKSTFLRLIAGFLKPSSGEITVNGSILYQPQKPVIFHMPVLNNAVIGMKNSDKKMAYEVLEEVGLKEFINAQSKNLSGGEQQRLSLARSLLTGGDIFLLDEPFSAVDIKSARKLEKILIDYCLNKTMILSTHSIKIAESIADRCIFIKDGRLEISSTDAAKEYLINTI
jgi:ABC-type multidrug transport system ATPase subunit